MKKGIYGCLFLCLIVTYANPASATNITCPAQQIDEYADVVHVHDGDTVRLRDGRKVRLIGINTPELATEDSPAEPMAELARDSLRRAVGTSNSHVGLVFGEQRRDHYGRTLAHLFGTDGHNFQAELLERGLALALTIAPNDAFSDCYRQAENTARCKQNGLWSQPGFASTKAEELEPGASGFRLINAGVQHIDRNTKGLWLSLSGGLLVGIRKADLAGFDENRLLMLKGASIRVRGWLNPKKTTHGGARSRWYMRIRHPAALEILPANTKAKC